MINSRPRCHLVGSLAFAFLLSTLAGCGSSGDGKTVTVTPEAQKKTEDMLNGIQAKMREMHKNMPKTGKTGRKGQ